MVFCLFFLRRYRQRWDGVAVAIHLLLMSEKTAFSETLRGCRASIVSRSSSSSGRSSWPQTDLLASNMASNDK